MVVLSLPATFFWDYCCCYRAYGVRAAGVRVQYNTTPKVIAQSFPTPKPTLLPTPLLHNHDCEKHIAFNSDYIAYIHELPNPSLYLILGVSSLGLDDCLNPPLHTPY